MSEAEYQEVMEKIQVYLRIVSEKDGFHALTPAQMAELERLSQLAEEWEEKE